MGGKKTAWGRVFETLSEHLHNFPNGTGGGVEVSLPICRMFKGYGNGSHLCALVYQTNDTEIDRLRANEKRRWRIYTRHFLREIVNMGDNADSLFSKTGGRSTKKENTVRT